MCFSLCMKEANMQPKAGGEGTANAVEVPTVEQIPLGRERVSWWYSLQQALWPTWMTRDMNLLLIARVCMSATRALAGIIVPIYLATIGFQGVLLGLLWTVTALVSALLSTGIGLLSDRFGRKPFLVITPCLAALASLVFAFSHVTGILFVFAALGSFGRGAGAGAGAVGPYQPAEQAFLADTVLASDRNRLFGRIGFASSLGALIGSGPLIALAGLFSFQNITLEYQLAFLMGAICALLAGLLALPLRETRHPLSALTHRKRGAKNERQPRVRLSPLSWKLLIRLGVTNSVNGLAVGFIGPFITYWFYLRYGAGPVEVGFLYTIINLAAMIANLLSAQAAARFGLVRTIVLTRVLQAALLIPMVLAPSFWLAGGIYLLRMMVQRLGLPLRQSYVMGVVPAEERGSVGSLSNLPSQASSALSPTLAGYLFDHVTLAMPFEIGALLQGINALLFFLFFRSTPPPEEKGTVPAVLQKQEEEFEPRSLKELRTNHYKEPRYDLLEKGLPARNDHQPPGERDR